MASAVTFTSPSFATARLQENSGLSANAIAQFVRISPRNLARRKEAGHLTTGESERLYRLALIVDRTHHLFEGDVDAARNWLTSPNMALAKATPLAFAESEVSAREVEDLIGRLEHGVFSWRSLMRRMIS